MRVAGAPVFFREILAHARRPRTYVFQTAFLGILVLCLIPLWPATGGGQSDADIVDTGRWIFTWGGYLQVVLLALLVPATTANAITQEKQKNTLDVLLLTGAGPFAIVWGKFFSRVFNLTFLLFLTVPLLFALLTLGGVAGSSILIEFAVLASFVVLGAGVGIFLSTILPKPTGVVIAGYVLMAGYLAAPLALEALGVLRPLTAGALPLGAATLSPLHDLIYVFQPSWFVAGQSFPESWWICPLWNVALGVVLVFVAGLLLPYARAFERLFSVRRLLEAFDRLTYDLLHPRQFLAKVGKDRKRLPVHGLFLLALVAIIAARGLDFFDASALGMPRGRFWGATAGYLAVWLFAYQTSLLARRPLVASAVGLAIVAVGYAWMPLAAAVALIPFLIVVKFIAPDLEVARAEQTAVERPGPVGERNPIYWKETSINTVGRFRTWWRVNLLMLVLMVAGYAVFLPQLSTIEFHKYAVATIAGLIVLLSTVIAATTVSQEREDGSLVLLATTPVECPTYVKGKVLGIARNIVFLVALPFLHVVLFVAMGVIHPVSVFFLAVSIPIAVISSIVQAVFVSLLFPTTLRAIMAAVVVVIVGATLPAVCCLPTFNLPVACYYMVEPVAGLGSGLGVTSQGSYLTAMALALVFSAGTQIGYIVVVYSLIRSGFDRYIGRAA